MKYLLYTFAILIQSSLFGQTLKNEDISVGEKIKIYSSVLNEEREIYIYQPSGFWGMDEQMENLPVVYVLDGESQFLSTVASIDFLSSAPQGNDFLPRSIIVGISNKDAYRNRDLTPIKGMIANDSTTLQVTGGGPAFLEFITAEIIPFIDNRYSTCDYRTIIGHSLGGLMAFEALLRKREYFNNYIAIDPGLGYANEAYLNQVLDTLRSCDLDEENLFFSAANNRPTFLSLEDLTNDTTDMMKLLDIPNQEFLSFEDSKDWQINVSMKYYPDENHFSVPYRSTYDAMKYFYGFYTFTPMMDYYRPEYLDRKDLLLRLKEHYNAISEIMGCEIIPMEGYLNSFAFGLGDFGRHDLAIELFNYNIELYRDRPAVYKNLAFYYKKNGNNKEAVEQFDKSLSMKFDEHIFEIRNQLNKDITDQNKR